MFDPQTDVVIKHVVNGWLVILPSLQLVGTMKVQNICIFPNLDEALNFINESFAPKI